jgi:hypothetical protein
LPQLIIATCWPALLQVATELATRGPFGTAQLHL